MKAFEKIMKRIPHLASTIQILAVSGLVFNAHGNGSSKGAPSVAASGSGNLTGTVKFPEESPEPEKITITKDQQVCGNLKYSKSLLISEETRGLKNVVVSMVNVKGKPPAASVITLDQKNCEYLPHVQAVPVGSRLEILNSDGILHNVHAYLNGLDPKDTVFNKAQPKFLKKINQVLEKSGTYYFKCDVHNHMSAIIAVLDHPYFAMTDVDGTFTIDDVPSGSYTIQAWHEILGVRQIVVQVESGKTSKVSFDMMQKEQE